MNQKGFANIIVIILIVVLIGIGGYVVSKQQNMQPYQTQKPTIEQPQEQQIQSTSNNFNILYPPTPSFFSCNPHAGMYTVPQGKVIQTYSQWKDLYDELLKNCYTKIDVPQLTDFDKQTMIAVFAGSSCTSTKVDVETISQESNKIIVHSVVTVGGCALPSFSYPFTLVTVDKTNLLMEFTFESIKHPNEPF